MPYTSKSDAVAKLIDSKTNHNGLNLFPSNLLFDSTTVFYSNSAKTILANAGNYVFATNYNSIYLSIGSDGKIIGDVTNTNADLSDTTWVDDRIYQNGVLVSNLGDIGGTILVIINNILTDLAWTSRQYNNPKRWQINNGKLNTTDLISINVSDMKGYDLMIATGEYANFKWVNWNWVQAFCHVKAEPNRQTIFGNKIYFFKPDYWIPNASFTGGVTYFRRMPNITTINDKFGRKKFWIDMARPLHDIAENFGVPRTSTVMNKGVSHAEPFSAYGYNFTVPKNKKYFFTGDAWILGPLSYLYLGYVDVNQMNGLMNEYLQNWATAMIESLIVDDYTWENGSSPTTGFDYIIANPYHWKTTFGSGTNIEYSPFSFLSTFYYANNVGNGDQIQFNAEYYIPHVLSDLFGQAFEELKLNIKNLILYGIDQISLGAVAPNFSAYGAGVYTTNGTTGWSEVDANNVLTSNSFNHYHNFFINNNITYNSIVNYRFFIGGKSAYQMSYISNYQIGPEWYFPIYSIVHNYDITKKIFAQLWGTPDNFNRAMTYSWNRQEVLGNNAGPNGYPRMTIPFPQYVHRPDQSPALNQSLAVWAMAYADGFFAWNDGIYFDELNTTDTEQQLGRASWDWAYAGYWQVYQNKDIVEANTNWLVPDYKKNTNIFTETVENYPIHLYANKRPICRYKLSVDGTIALVICTSPYNNGYTKETHTFRLPAKSNYEFTIDTWGTYTTVIRLINL